jgi:peptidoglycan/LPS O-acetylase OafA/YrhL
MAGVVIPGRPGSGWRTTWHSVVARSPGLAVILGPLSMVTYRFVEAPALRRKRAPAAAQGRMSPAEAQAAP